jgi:hypothetical protein
LDKRVQNLHRDYRRLGDLLHSIRDRLHEILPPSAVAPKVKDLLKIRRRGRQLLKEIRKHKEDETILLMDNVTVDIGVGD